MPERVQDFQGQSYHKLRRACRRRGALFKDPLFPAAPQSLFYQREPPAGLTWKRPRVSSVRQWEENNVNIERVPLRPGPDRKADPTGRTTITNVVVAGTKIFFLPSRLRWSLPRFRSLSFLSVSKSSCQLSTRPVHCRVVNKSARYSQIKAVLQANKACQRGLGLF